MSTAPAPVPPSKLRRLWRSIRFFALAYLGIIVVLMLMENWLIFHPTSARTDWLPPGPVKAEDVYLPLSDGVRVHAWWCPHPEAKGAVLYLHGNAGNLSYRRSAIKDWHDQFGESVLIVDYPGFGRSEGSPNEAGCYAAAEAAFLWLTESKGLPAEGVILYGKSLGGGVAVELATRHPHRALVLAKTFTSMPDLAQSLYPWLPARWLVRAQFNSLEKIARCTRPIFVTHGDCDGLIPCWMGQRLHEAAMAPKYFLPLPGHDHNGALPAEFYASLKRFLASVESPQPAN